MAEETEFAMGATASCVDGPGGKVTRVIIDPATETVATGYRAEAPAGGGQALPARPDRYHGGRHQAALHRGRVRQAGARPGGGAGR